MGNLIYLSMMPHKIFIGWEKIMRGSSKGIRTEHHTGTPRNMVRRHGVGTAELFRLTGNISYKEEAIKYAKKAHTTPWTLHRELNPINSYM